MSILVCSKNRSSVLAASKVLVSSPPSPSPSSSSFSDSSAPKGLAALVSPNVEETLGDAKLDFPEAADPNPPPIPLNPVALGAAVKGLADLKTDDVDDPRVPNGDFSEPANPPSADPANAELEAGLSSVLAGDSVENGDLAPASLAKGESTALAKALAEKSWNMIGQSKIE